MFGTAESVDPIQYSLNNADFTKALYGSFLNHPILDRMTPAQKTQALLRLRYKIALCDIGEPPLPTQEEIDRENGRREMIAAIERTERDVYIGAYEPIGVAA